MAGEQQTQISMDIIIGNLKKIKFQAVRLYNSRRDELDAAACDTADVGPS
jgi:hypothetical protein